MNLVKTLNTDYIKPSRTIETVLVSSGHWSQLLFVYNYEGQSFRVFLSHLKLINFFKEEHVQSDFHFDSEIELDQFLDTLQVN